MGVPSFSGGGGQDRARGRHLTAANTLSAFGRFNQGGGGGGGGGAVRFRPIQPVWGGCPLLGRWGGGGGGGCCPLSANLTSRGGGGGAVAFGQFNQSGVRRFNQWVVEAQLRRGVHVCKQWGGAIQSQRGGPWPLLPPPGDAHEDKHHAHHNTSSLNLTC